MGIEFREGSLTITPTCHAVATKGMIFNVNIGFSGLVNKEASDSKGKEVALFIGDTILVCFLYGSIQWRFEYRRCSDLEMVLCSLGDK